MEKLVLDSTCFVRIHALPPIFAGKSLLATGLVCGEMRSGEAVSRFEKAREEFGIIVKNPKKASLENARKIAKGANDCRLSEADLSVLALAIEENASVATDDYSLQNACLHAQVGIIPVSSAGIEKKVRFSPENAILPGKRRARDK